MNRTAIDDLLRTILSTWCQSAAHWAAPGVLSASTCATCSASLLADAIDVTAWPHDLMHDLATALHTAVTQIADSRSGEGWAGRDDPKAETVEVQTVVNAIVIEHRHILLDVLTECVEPRLQAYLADAAVRGLGEVAEWSNGNSGH